MSCQLHGLCLCGPQSESGLASLNYSHAPSTLSSLSLGDMDDLFQGWFGYILMVLPEEDYGQGRPKAQHPKPSRIPLPPLRPSVNVGPVSMGASGYPLHCRPSGHRLPTKDPSQSPFVLFSLMKISHRPIIWQYTYNQLF